MRTAATSLLVLIAVGCLTWLAYCHGFTLLLSSEPTTFHESESLTDDEDDEPNPRLPVFDPCAPRMHRN